MSPGLLRGQLERWTNLAGYQLVWKVSRDYYLQSSVAFNDSFPNALKKLFTGLQARGNSLRATIYNGNMVVLVSEE
ncbi:MAG: toxin co-regulated pilus biosynthesis Q family protein [Desulfovibrio sp.]|nr:toxin co-regulated pilus biosynthesis Q family protein [Desulfovibrio sp.]